MPVPSVQEHAAHIDAIIDAALAAAAPGPALAAAWRACKPAPPKSNFGLIAVGKAAVPMTNALLHDCKATPAHGVVITPPAIDASPLAGVKKITLLESDHPLPTPRSLAAAELALETAARCRDERTPLIVLLSGGASALMCAPQPGLTIDDLSTCTQALLRAGASIDELNTVRALCDRVKAGGLALAAAPAPVHTFILSDVIGDKLPIIGSGPSVAPSSGGAPTEALDILKHYKLEKTCKPIAAHLRVLAAATARDGSAESRDWSNVRATIIANNTTALDAAAARAHELGFEIGDKTAGIHGEARDTAFAFVGAIRRARSRAGGKPVAVLWGGETTVRIRDANAPRASKGGKSSAKSKAVGVGGRNQEAALTAAIAIDNDLSIIIATFATDGIDGPPPNDAAGAIVTGRTAAEARQGGIDPEDALAANDSHTFFTKRGGHLKPGPTGTNVNDIWIGLAY